MFKLKTIYINLIKQFTLTYLLLFLGIINIYGQTQTIQGRLINQRNFPVQGMRVTVLAIPGLKAAITDQNGRFTLRNIPKNQEIDYQNELVVYDTEYNKTNFTVAVEQEVIVIVDVKPLPVKTVKVINPEGDIIPDIEVSIEGNPIKFKTDEDGQFKIKGIANNEQRYYVNGVAITNRSYNRKKKTITITTTETAEVADETNIGNIVDIYEYKEKKLNKQQKDVENQLELLQEQLNGEITPEKRALLQQEIRDLQTQLDEINDEREILKKEAEKTIDFLREKLGVEKEKTKDAEHKQELAEKEKEKSDQAFYFTIVISSIIVVLLIVIVLIFYFTGKRIRKQKQEIEEKSITLAQQKEELATQADNLKKANEEINIKNSELTGQKVILEEQHGKITQSIEYALTLQESILPTQSTLSNVFDNNLMIFYKPKDIVSGDFYWFSQQEDVVFLAAIDCTGHGVPGGFMTMMGNSLLNHIVNERQVYEPDKILTELHQRVQYTLKSQQKEGQDGDGMDMALIKIDLVSKRLTFAGAKNPLLVVDDNGIRQIKPTKISIGSTLRNKNKEFKQEELILTGNEVFYLVSDGFQDQLGFPENENKKKKYMKGRFLKLLNEISQLSIEEQNTKLEKEFYNWKGDVEQTDDVLILGLKACFLDKHEVYIPRKAVA